MLHENEKYILDIPFSDGKRIRLVVGREAADIDQWINSEDPRKVFCAQVCLAAAAGSLISSDEFHQYIRGFPRGGPRDWIRSDVH